MAKWRNRGLSDKSPIRNVNELFKALEGAVAESVQAGKSPYGEYGLWLNGGLRTVRIDEDTQHVMCAMSGEMLGRVRSFAPLAAPS